jgi:hypothetical protein
MRSVAYAVLFAAAFTLSACTTNAPKRPPELESNLTYDGLAKVKNATVKGAWMRPDFSLAGYTKIMLQGAGIEYRPIKNVGGSNASTATAFPLTQEQKERLRSTVGDAFRAELEKSQKFQLVDQPGPDVLTIFGGLVDVVSYVPPDPIGRSSIYLRSVGEATLVLEIRDSESNAVLVRVIDRRAAQQTDGALKSNSVTNWAEVQQVARAWATQLRTRLEDAALWSQQ